MTSPLLLQFGLPVLSQILSETLKRVDHPVAKGAASAIDGFNRAIAMGQISPEQVKEANRHAETMAQMQMEEAKAAYEQVNQSLRAEVGSSDAYVRRMRPTFGYLMALTWAAQMFAIAYVIVFDTAKAGQVLEAMSSLSMIWAVGLSVLGVYVYKRSEEKKMAVQQEEEVSTISVAPRPVLKPRLND